MKYFEVNFSITPATEDYSDILSSMLAEVGFEAFETVPDGLVAWIQQSQYSAEDVDSVISSYPIAGVEISYATTEAPDENWNQQWEQEGFQPIILQDESDGRVLIAIHDIRHTDIPQAQYDIRISPRQAFGTGSHETTRMILRQLLSLDLTGRHVVDAGTGTGILAIMCMMLGASQVFAYDIDEWSVENARDNLLLNDIYSMVEVALGDSSALDGKYAKATTQELPSLLIANINRNILLNDIPVFAQIISNGGEMLLSGFYVQDIPMLLDKAAEYGFTLKHQQRDGDWAMILLKKDKSR